MRPQPAPTGPFTCACAEDQFGDAELARGLAAGDEECLAVAYRRWSALVHAPARRSLGDEQEAEDVTQQVFLGVWRGRAGCRSERGSLGGWIVGITRRRIADAPAARARRGRLLAAAGTGLPLTDLLRGPRPDPDRGTRRLAARHGRKPRTAWHTTAAGGAWSL